MRNRCNAVPVSLPRCRIAIVGAVSAFAAAHLGSAPRSQDAAPPPAAELLKFDAVSVKASDPLDTVVPGGPIRFRRMVSIGGPGATDPGRIRYSKSLTALIAEAYEVTPLQLKGMGSIMPDYFDINATIPPSTTKHEFHLMLQNFLIERFHLTVHRETAKTSGYALAVSRKGSLLESNANAALVQPPGTAPIYTDAAGRPHPRLTGKPGVHEVIENRGWTVAFEQQTMADFARYLHERFRAPVVDTTGISGKYDFVLAFFPPDWGIPSPEETALEKVFPQLTKAIQSQLGLKLQPKRLPGDRIVVDHVDLVPTDN